MVHNERNENADCIKYVLHKIVRHAQKGDDTRGEVGEYAYDAKKDTIEPVQHIPRQSIDRY